MFSAPPQASLEATIGGAWRARRRRALPRQTRKAFVAFLDLSGEKLA